MKSFTLIFIFFFTVLFNSCTETSNTEEMQEAVDEQRKEEKIEQEKFYNGDNDEDYEVRRIPADNDEPRPDAD